MLLGVYFLHFAFMKIQVKFSFAKSQSRPFDQSRFQKFWYSCMDEKTRTRIHGHIPWLFSCSNIYVEKSSIYQAWTNYNFVFSTCDQEVLQSVYEWLLIQKNHLFGDNKITISSVKILPDEKVRAGKVLSAKTPIVISLDAFIGSKFGITIWEKTLYRVKDHGFEVWVKQFHKNILRKYVLLIKQWYIQRLTEWDKQLIWLYDDENKMMFDDFSAWCNFFSGYKYRRNAVAKYKDSFVWWSVWDLVIADDIYGIRVLQKILPLGVGERSTAGFGWIG